jgi:hypothetical protein
MGATFNREDVSLGAIPVGDIVLALKQQGLLAT